MLRTITLSRRTAFVVKSPVEKVMLIDALLAPEAEGSLEMMAGMLGSRDVMRMLLFKTVESK